MILSIFFTVYGCSSNFNCVGNGKGIASYAADNFKHQSDITETTFQLSKHCHTYLDVICVYRSSNDKQDKILAQIKTLFNKEKATYQRKEKKSHNQKIIFSDKDYLGGFLVGCCV